MGWANSRKNQWRQWGDLGEKVSDFTLVSWVWGIHVFPGFLQAWTCSAAGVSSMCWVNPKNQEGLQVLTLNERMMSHMEILSSPVVPLPWSSSNTAFGPWIPLSRDCFLFQIKYSESEQSRKSRPDVQDPTRFVEMLAELYTKHWP